MSGGWPEVGAAPSWALLALALLLLAAAARRPARRTAPLVSRAACVAAAAYLLGAVALGDPSPFASLAAEMSAASGANAGSPDTVRRP